MLSEGWSQDFPFTNIRGVEGVPHDVPYEGYLVHARSAWKSSDTMQSRDLLMLNQGDGTFRESDLVSPGDDHTTALALADVNADGHFDILVGND